MNRFHPVVARWFDETFGTPTPAQAQGWEAIRSGRHTLIAAPTGSGKTLAAFLTALDDLFREGLRGAAAGRGARRLRLAAEGAQRRHPQEPGGAAARDPRARRARSASRRRAITAAVRTGDTTQSERAAMLRTPPHILVTTPESLYLLLTAERSREMLRTVRTVIVDEIHAVIGTRRGAHLALSLERLQQVAEQPLLAHRPLGDAEADRRGRARSWSAARRSSSSPPRDCAIVDEGHRRAIDLGHRDAAARRSKRSCRTRSGRSTTTGSPRSIGEHRTTLVFVNTRRMAERLARHLSERLGDDAVTAHHGSLSKEKRLDAETRLKSGRAARRWSRRRRWSSASTSATSISSARSARRTASRRCCSASADRATRSPARRRAGCSRSRATTWSSARRCCDAVRRGELDRIVVARRAARRARAADRRRDGVPRIYARTSCSRWCGGRGRTATLDARGFRRRRGDGWPTASRRGAAGAARSCTATRCTRRCAAGAAPGCWR